MLNRMFPNLMKLNNILFLQNILCPFINIIKILRTDKHLIFFNKILSIENLKTSL